MCKHVLNAQVSIRAPCCKKWFDCAQCHAESADHELKKQTEMILACKKCRKVFRIDTSDFDADSDGHCKGCDNRFYLVAETPEEKGGIMIGFEGSVDMIHDSRAPRRMPGLHDDPRMRGEPIFGAITGSSAASSSSSSSYLMR